MVGVCGFREQKSTLFAGILLWGCVRLCVSVRVVGVLGVGLMGRVASRGFSARPGLWWWVPTTCGCGRVVACGSPAAAPNGHAKGGGGTRRRSLTFHRDNAPCA